MQIRSTKITITIILSIFAIASSTSAQQKVDSSVELSPAGQKALDILMSAKQFEDTYVGYGGELSKLVAAYRDILKEPKRVEVLKFLLEKGSKPGQLYALAGLYDTDYIYFQSVVERYKADHSEVGTLSGCIGGMKEVSEIVFFDKPNTIRLEHPKQAFNDWRKKLGPSDGFYMDISGGGYSLMFRGRDL